MGKEGEGNEEEKEKRDGKAEMRRERYRGRQLDE